MTLCSGTFGDPADPAILLIPGAGDTMLSWDERFCERLAAGGRHVIRYDPRGMGRSPAGGSFGMRDLVADAAGLLEGPAHVVGVSLGGGVAQLLALDRPERVSALTLAASTPGGPGHSQPDLPGISPELAAYFGDERPDPDWSDRAAVVEYLVESERPFSPAFDEAASREAAGRVFDHSTDLEASRSGAFDFDAGEPWRDRLGTIAVPVLVAHGLQDPLFPIEHGRALAAEIPGARRLELDGMGHEYFPPHTWDVVIPAILRVT
jgi:pimeloyl-ACP methyl ester carboxylesterase